LIADLSTDSALQTAANVALLDLDEYAQTVLHNNFSLIQALQEYEKYGKDPYRHTKPVVFFLHHQLQQAKQNGMYLSVDKKSEFQNLQQIAQQLAGKFRSNIVHDQRYLLASAEELRGLDVEFLANLTCDHCGNYLVPVNQKNYDLIMHQCVHSNTRRDFFMLFKQLGYPSNEPILTEIRATLNKMAQLLNFDNWAEYQLSSLNVKSIKKVESFLHGLMKDVQSAQEQNYALFTAYAPLNMSLSADQKLYPWDYDYLKNMYNQKHFALDDSKISEYFVLDRFLPTLLKQLSKFFYITFEEQQNSDIWAPGVICYRVRSLKHQAVLGYLFFDLYQRFAKREVAPYELPLVPVIRDDCSIPCVGATVVVANFKSGDDNTPTLLTFKDVTRLTFQIGQALHSIFAATRFTQFSGHQVSYDFEHMSGQMLMHWLQEPTFLQLISSHKNTAHALDRKTIEKLIARDRFEQNNRLLQEIFLSVVALRFFQGDDTCEFHHWIEKLYKKIFRHTHYVPGDFFEMSFAALSDIDHGAGYYAPLWSEVIAADLFAKIKDYGILNHEIGMEYVTDILSPGGAKYPSDMIKKFLGRSANRKAFVSQL
ncbi:hypothetical protein KAZ82_01675, partial [Candidatus Babeliales bacterium]|nr:hypothetical protein [Candidatus Babeliales bacterium]